MIPLLLGIAPTMVQRVVLKLRLVQRIGVGGDLTELDTEVGGVCEEEEATKEEKDEDEDEDEGGQGGRFFVKLFIILLF